MARQKYDAKRLPVPISCIDTQAKSENLVQILRFTLWPLMNLFLFAEKIARRPESTAVLTSPAPSAPHGFTIGTLIDYQIGTWVGCPSCFVRGAISSA